MVKDLLLKYIENSYINKEKPKDKAVSKRDK